MCLYGSLGFERLGWYLMGKVRLKIVHYTQGNRIASVPLRRLKKLSECKKRRWDLKVSDGHVWLILEAF